MKLLLLFSLAAGAFAQSAFYLKDGDRVVFFGDSITDQRLYTTFAETYVVTRFPNLNVSFTHSGWGGDRVTGGGGGPIDVRLQRDVLAYHPTVMTIMLGMNDGGYRAFDQKIFETYTSGYEHIIDVVKKAIPNLRITVVQPSPYDDVTRAPTFAGGYNGTLTRYSQYLQELAKKDNLHVADLNTPVVEDLRKANQLDSTLAPKLIPDRVHPGPAGHLLMAEALLKAWHAPALVTAVEIDAASGKLKAENTKAGVTTKNGTLAWTQSDNALPFPIDWNDRDKLVPLAMHSSDFLDALNRETLKVTGLTAPRYALKIDGDPAGTFTKDELAAGVNLAALQTPMMKQAQAVHALTKKRTDVHNFRWRAIQVPMEGDELPHKAAAVAALDQLDEELAKAQHAAAQPRPHQFELVTAQ